MRIQISDKCNFSTFLTQCEVLPEVNSMIEYIDYCEVKQERIVKSIVHSYNDRNNPIVIINVNVTPKK